MSKKDFFVVLIKLFGLYSMILTIFTVIPTNINFLSYGVDDPLFIFYTLGVMVFTILLFSVLIFNAEKVCKILRLEKGFDSEEFNLGYLSEKTIVKLASIILGGYLVINDVPRFLNNTLYAIQSQNVDIPFDSDERFFWVVGLLRICIGLFLVLNFKYVQRILIRKSAPNNA